MHQQIPDVMGANSVAEWKSESIQPTLNRTQGLFRLYQMWRLAIDQEKY